jgi:SAM-dependent methyltransferase
VHLREQAVLTGSPYDAIAYPGHPFAQTHPDRLATIATLFGLAPAPPDECRVLELGCGDAGNLAPMALALPASRFVGIDAAPGAIARARRLADALGLGNVELVATRIEDYEPPENGFDYVIAHGVYSWISAPVRDRLLATCRTVLAADGVAYVSYNALPGGRLREALRDMLVFHTGGIDDARERVTQARGLLRFLLAGWSADQPFAAAMRGYVERLADSDDALLAHDELAEDNASVYFHEFAAHAARHELQYLAEADFFELQTGVVPDAVSDALREVGDVVRREQYLDFLKGRMFRQTLLCGAEARIDRRPRPEVVEQFAVSSPARARRDAEADERMTFEGPAGSTLTTDHPLVARALERVCERWPAAVTVRELLAGETQEHDRSAVCDALLRAYGANLVQLHVCPPALSLSPGERPEASPLARHQAREGAVVTNLRHTSVRIEDDLGRRLVELLDGRRDRAQLAAELHAFLSETGAPVPDDLEDGLERSLRGLARLALLRER